MKTLLISSIATLILSTSSFAGDNNSAKHFGLSAIFGYGTETYIHDKYDLTFYERIGYSTAIGSLPGLAKELNDTKFDGEDMAFNVLGALSGSLLSNYLNDNVFVAVEHNSKKKTDKILVSYKF